MQFNFFCLALCVLLHQSFTESTENSIKKENSKTKDLSVSFLQEHYKWHINPMFFKEREWERFRTESLKVCFMLTTTKSSVHSNKIEN